MNLIKINSKFINNSTIHKLFLVSSEKTLNLLVIILNSYGTLQRRAENSGIYRTY